MKLAEIRKALVPLVGILLVAAADALGVAPEIITDEVSIAVTALLLGVAAAVYQIPNKEKDQ